MDVNVRISFLFEVKYLFVEEGYFCTMTMFESSYMLIILSVYWDIFNIFFYNSSLCDQSSLSSVFSCTHTHTHTHTHTQASMNWLEMHAGLAGVFFPVTGSVSVAT